MSDRECEICEGPLSDKRVPLSWELLDCYGRHVCDTCVVDGGAVAELIGVELPLEQVLGDLPDEVRDPVCFVFARLGYLPFDDARSIAAELSEATLLAQPGMTARVESLVWAAFESRGVPLAEKPRWPSVGAPRHVELQPRAGLNPHDVCQAQALLSAGFTAAQSAVGVPAALAALLELDRGFREHLADAHGQGAEIAAHIESRELATLHAALHKENGSHAPARKTED